VGPRQPEEEQGSLGARAHHATHPAEAAPGRLGMTPLTLDTEKT
jgi:hypothetical protein